MFLLANEDATEEIVGHEFVRIINFPLAVAVDLQILDQQCAHTVRVSQRVDV